MMRLLILCALASVGLLLARGALADGLAFDGDTPRFPHFFLELDSAQKQAIASEQRQGSKYVEIRLTPAQREVVKKEAGATVRWLFAVDRKALEGECSCGAYNLGVLIGGRLAVLNRRLGDHLSPCEVTAIELDLSGGAPPTTSPGIGPPARAWAVFEYRRGRLVAVAVSTEYGRAGGFAVGSDP